MRLGMAPYTNWTEGPRFIRGTHPDQYRSGQWAEILTVAPSPVDGKDCYVIRFPDGKTDWWLVDDPSDRYEFSDNPPEAQA